MGLFSEIFLMQSQRRESGATYLNPSQRTCLPAALATHPEQEWQLKSKAETTNNETSKQSDAGFLSLKFSAFSSCCNYLFLK